MGIAEDHRKWAESCMAMAQAAEDDKDMAVWLILAQSWVRLAEDAVLLGDTDEADETYEGDDPVRMQASSH